jgi:dTDP-4-amino-4,6-dideoxygalactose transaminase
VKSTVALCDLEALDRELGPALRAAVDRVASGGQFVLGETVASFERAMATHHGVAHAIGVGSGSDALVLALRANGVGRDDVVITTPLSFVATVEAILRLGARPYFVDTDEHGLLCPEALARALERVPAKAVVPVHLYGRVATGLASVAQDVPVVHDAAQAVGARDVDQALGATGTACLSFFPSKNLGAWGDGGMVLCDDEAVAAKVRRGRVHGHEEGRWLEVGLNSRLDAVHAAVLEVKLAALGDHEAARRAVVDRYRESLADLAWLRLPAPLRPSDCCHLFTVRVAAEQRAGLQCHLRAHGIDSRIYYPRLLSDEPVVAPSLAGMDALTGARRLAAEVLTLPVHPFMDDLAVARVVDAVRSFTSP